MQPLTPEQTLRIKQAFTDPAQLQQLVALLPDLLEPPLYFWTPATRTAENVAFGNWSLPSHFYKGRGLRVIDEPYRLYGVQGHGKILWECHDAWQTRCMSEVQYLALQRGFTIKQDTEFYPWLAKRMRDLAHLQPSAGWPAPGASPHRPQS